jgi:hypothetical protein
MYPQSASRSLIPFHGQPEKFLDNGCIFDVVKGNNVPTCKPGPYRRKRMDLKRLKDTPPWEWPEDAGKTFLGELLDSEDEDIAEAAYEALTIAEGLAGRD